MSADDAGLVAIAQLHEQMMIDERWTLRRPRGFTWWGYRLAQHVDASEPTPSKDGALGCAITVRTEVARRVPRADAKAAAVMNMANLMQSMNALVYDAETGSIDECATASMHDDTVHVWVPVLAVAAVLQATAAHSRAHAVAEALGGAPAVSQHPRSGERPSMDDLLNGPQFWASELGAKPSRFGGSLLADLVEFGGSWSACNGDESGFTGEVPYSGNRSALELMMMGVAGERETSLVRMHADQPHPLLGSGLLMRTQLPVEIDGDGEMIANDLNRREASGAAPCKLLGAWCVADDSLHHVSFVPSLLARPGLLQNLYVDSAVRSAWAHEVLGH